MKYSIFHGCYEAEYQHVLEVKYQNVICLGTSRHGLLAWAQGKNYNILCHRTPSNLRYILTQALCNMWPILVEKPDGPWSNCYGGLGLGPPHHRQRHLCLPSITLGLYCPKLVFFQCCPQIMHTIVQVHYPNIDFLSPLGFGVQQNGFWGWAWGFLYLPTYAVYILTQVTYPPT